MYIYIYIYYEIQWKLTKMTSEFSFQCKCKWNFFVDSKNISVSLF